MAYLDQVASETHRMFYQRPLIIYKGVNNLVQVDLRNQDQKRVNNVADILVITILDPRSQLRVLTKDFTSSGSGLYEVTISEREIDDFTTGSYEFSLVLETRQGLNTGYNVYRSRLCYSDSQFGSKGILELRGSVQGEFVDSYEIKNFAKVSPQSVGEANPSRYESSVIDTGSMGGPSKPTHTLQFYTQGYSGSIDIQTAQDNDPRPNEWTTLRSITASNYNSFYVNFSGIYRWIRIVHTPTIGTVDKILYR
jgi:hypothetical protein